MDEPAAARALGALRDVRVMAELLRRGPCTASPATLSLCYSLAAEITGLFAHSMLAASGGESLV